MKVSGELHRVLSVGLGGFTLESRGWTPSTCFQPPSYKAANTRAPVILTNQVQGLMLAKD